MNKDLSEITTLPHLAAVLAYLDEAGWQVTKTSLYRHRKEGKIAPRPTGAYDAAAVDRYARTWLRQRSTGKRLREDAEDLQRRKLSLDIQTAEVDLARRRFQHEREQGLWIRREEMDLELAGRAGILDTGLHQWIASSAAEWLRFVGGDAGRLPEWTALLENDLDRHLHIYASPVDYEVLFEAETAEPAEVPE